MRRMKKLFLWSTGILGTLLILLLLALLLLPYFITLEPVRQKIMAGISQRIDGQFLFQNADFSFFPRPRIVIRKAQLQIPEKVSAAAEAITIAPQIIPLLQGKARISLIQAEAPTVRLDLVRKSYDKESSIPSPSAIIQEHLPRLLKFLESEAPQLTVELEKGSLDLRMEKESVFWFREIQGRITLPPDQLRIDLTCKSNLWEKGSITAQIGSKDLNGNASIRVIDLDLRAMQDSLAPAAAPRLERSPGNLMIGLEIVPGKTVRGGIQASFPSLTFQHGGKKSSLKGIAMSGAFQIEEDKATISLAELSLQNPGVRFRGGFFVDFSAPFLRLELSGEEIDVIPVREIITGLGGKTGPMPVIFDIVQEGKIPFVSFKAQGRSPIDLGELKNISVQGRLVGGRVFLSESLTRLKGVNFDLRQVQGEVLISQGMLEGRNLAAQWEKARVAGGLLKLGLSGNNALFHLEAPADADLAQFLPFLKKIIGNKNFSEELDRLRNLQGRVQGKLTLGEALNSIQPRIDIQKMSLSARHDRIPFPVQVEGVQGSYDGTKIVVRNLKGSVGQSFFEDISGQITLDANSSLSLRSGKSSIALDEIYAWQKSIEEFKIPLQDFKLLKGSVTLSSLGLSGPLSQPGKWDYRIEGEVKNLAAHYGPVPYPLQIEKAGVSFDGKKLNIQNLNGAVGKSLFSEISGQIDLGESPYIALPSGRSSIAIEEIYDWLRSVERFKVPLQDIKSLKGVMALSSMSLKGPLLQPEKWGYRVAGEIERVTMEASSMPGPLSIEAAKFEADSEKILLHDSQVNILDASLKISATGNFWQWGLRSFEGTFRGDLGTQVIEWASARFQIPKDRRVRAPFAISRAQVGWDQENGISFAGNCQWPKGPAAFIDVLYTPKMLTVNRMHIADDHSQAEIRLKVQQKELHLDFKGNLERPTMDRILAKNELAADSIRGDFQAHVFIDDLLRSTAQGKIEGTGFRLALPIGVPVLLQSFSLDVDRNKIRVQSAGFSWEDRYLTMEGSIDLLPEAILLDMNVSADGLQWEKIEKNLTKEDRKTPSGKTGPMDLKLEASSPKETQFPPLRGRIGVKSPYLEYQRFTWRPLSAEITFFPDEIRVTLTEANVCGISTSGVVKVASGNIALDFHPLAEDQELSSSAACLAGKPQPMFGSFNFNGRIKGQGQTEDLLSSLQGPWQFGAKDGGFYHGSILMRILTLLNLQELFTGDKNEPSKREVKYKTLQANGHVESGKVFIKELAMNTPGMQVFSQGAIDFVNRQIDLVMAIAPLKRADWLVKHLPVIDYVLGGTLVSIPVKVKGDLNDPRIIPLDPAEIGSDFVGIMTRTLKVPFKLIKPIFKDLERGKQQPSLEP